MDRLKSLAAHQGPRTLIALDIESRPDAFARRICGRGGAAPSNRLWEITYAAVVIVRCDGEWNVTDTAFEIFDTEVGDEFDLLENLEACIARHDPAGMTLLTYDGARHDLPLIRSRQVRWWLPDRLAIQRAAAECHLDVGLWFAGRPGRVPALRDSCASVGIAINPLIRVGGDEESFVGAKCQLDTLGTLILGLYALADLHGSADPLLGVMPGLRPHLERWACGRPHLEGLALNPVFQQPVGPWGMRLSEPAWPMQTRADALGSVRKALSGPSNTPARTRSGTSTAGRTVH